MKALVLIQMVLVLLACAADEAATATRSSNDLATLAAHGCRQAVPGDEVPVDKAVGDCLFAPANSR
jgi:hypothetical protein